MPSAPKLGGHLSNENFRKICNYTTNQGEEWYCQARPEDNACGKIIWNGEKIGQFKPYWSLSEILSEYKFDRAYENLVFSKDDFEIKSSDNTENCNFEAIQGYWDEGIWYDSLFPKSKVSISERLQNKSLVMLGDSFTNRIDRMLDKELIDKTKPLPTQRKILHSYQFLNLQKDYYQPSCKPIQAWGALHSKFLATNTSRYIVTEGVPVSKDQCIGASIFSSEIIRRMVENQWFGEKYIILLTHGAHFASWSPIVFYNRMIAIRNEILKYKQKEQEFLSKNNIPSHKTAIFIYKTPNWARNNIAHNFFSVVSGFQLYRIREIAFKIFGNPYLDKEKMFFSNDEMRFPVKVYDSFGPSFVAFDALEPGNPHPDGYVERQILDGIFDLLQLVEDQQNGS